MTEQCQICISFDEFFTAVSRLPTMKRPPGGKKGGEIPSDTLLSKDPEGLIVETSVISTYVAASKPWEIQVSVDAKKLIEMCKRLKAIGAGGQSIEVGIKERDLILKFKTTSFLLPTLWVKDG